MTSHRAKLSILRLARNPDSTSFSGIAIRAILADRDAPDHTVAKALYFRIRIAPERRGRELDFIDDPLDALDAFSCTAGCRFEFIAGRSGQGDGARLSRNVNFHALEARNFRNRLKYITRELGIRNLGA